MCVCVCVYVCVFVALGIQQARFMRRIIFCGLPRSTKFSTLSHIRYDFRKKKVTEHKMRVLIFSTLLSKHYSLQEEMSEI